MSDKDKEQLNERADLLHAMYGQEPGDDTNDDAPRPMPEQLRLAGKATLIPHKGDRLAVPRIEYVETLEQQVREQARLMEEMRSRMKKMELNLNRLMNIANRKIANVESDVQQLQNRRPWE